MSRGRRVLELVLPSVIAASAASILAGASEAIPYTYGVLAALAATGFVALLGIPAGTALIIVARLTWRAWRFDEVVGGMRNERGGTPRLAAWLSYLILAGSMLSGVAYQSLRILFASTPSRVTITLGSTLAVTLFVLILVAVSLPSVGVLSAMFERLDARLSRNRDRSLMSPRAIMFGLAVILGVIGAASWLIWIRPRLGTYDVLPWIYVGLYFVALVAFGRLYLHLRSLRARLISGVIVGIVSVSSITGAAFVRTSQPYSMLEIWGETKVSGQAIDVLFDIESMRGELRTDDILPLALEGAVAKDIVLITIDTLRADRTPLHGGGARMPGLAQLGREGAVFEWAFASGNVTRRSLPTIATGISPRRIRGRIAGWALRLDPRHVTLAERFRAAGYETAGFFCCNSQFGEEHQLGLNRGIDHLVIEGNNAELSKIASEWVKARDASKASKPLFVWIHMFDPHRWDRDFPRKKHGDRIKYRYDLALSETDRNLSRILDAVWSVERRDRTFIAVTSDHGEGLGDHGVKFHATTLYNTEMHVPLVVVGPDVKRMRVPEPVGLVDLAPTLLELAGYEPPGMPDMDGLSFADVVLGKRRGLLDAGEAYFSMVPDHSVRQSIWGLVSGRYKLIDPGGGRPELYDIVTDPKEAANLAETRPELLEEMQRRLARRKRLDRVPPF